MTSLPKRGDRVRVTETLYQPSLLGSELELTHDAHWYDDSQTWMRFRCEQAGYVGPVKVEIPERADRFDCCGGSDEHSPEHTQDCSERPASERICADCGMPVTHRVHRGFGPCGGRSVKTVHPEFARGMRRAVEIAEGLPWQLSKGDYLVEKLKEAVEKEIAGG